jgi:hypothetical protein
MEIHDEHVGDTWIVTAKGRLDGNASANFADHVGRLIESANPKLLIDFTGRTKRERWLQARPKQHKAQYEQQEHYHALIIVVGEPPVSECAKPYADDCTGKCDGALDRHLPR